MSYDCKEETRFLYIHWPFCPYRCTFCPFIALAAHEQFMVRYHEALKREIQFFAQKADGKQKVQTVFFGGGTPSTYPDELLLDMFVTLEDVFALQEDAEVSIEVNPGTVRPEQLLLWKNVGINRISMGVQSLDDTVLKMLGRPQSAQNARELVHDAAMIFDNLSVDLIIGLPGVSRQAWESMLHEIVTWPIQHISIYFLTIHENTKLYFEIQKRVVQVLSDDAMIDAYQWSVDLLRHHGFDRYETSNFARKGYASVHNSAYWEHKPYKGFGLGACSFDGCVRHQNCENLNTYLECVERGTDPCFLHERLTQSQRRLEKIMLGLRRSCGIALLDLTEGLSQEQRDCVEEEIALLRKSGFVNITQDRLVLTDAGFVVQNEIAVRLCKE
jgi:oxygen-independent coproporphyrinogen III oxidase